MTLSDDHADTFDGRHFLSSDEVKRDELEILLRFAEMCDSLGLKYSLAGGTLLGAVRHHGFIPWDDDIDVCMARPDYERFVAEGAALVSEVGLRFEPYYGTTMETTPFVKLVNPSIAVQAWKEAKQSYLWVDVFPVDGLPDNPTEVERIYNDANVPRQALIAAATTASSGRNVLRRVVKAVMDPVLRTQAAGNAFGRKLNEIARAVPYGSTESVGSITWGMYGVGECIPLSGFEKQTPIQFEGHEFTCMSCWDEYLTGIYGDYMQLPPVEQRVSHGLKAWHTKKDE